MSEKVKIWITKYALTSGIFETCAVITGDNMASYKRDGRYTEFAHGKQFHLSNESAIAEAEEMRIKKLKSLEKQIKKVSAIKF